MLNPVALSIISQVFTGRVERARALGFWGAVVGISMALGPVVGGFLIELDQLARRVLDQPADLCRGHRADRDLRARDQVARPCATSTRSVRGWRWCSCSAWSSRSSRARATAGPTPASSPPRWSPWSPSSAFLRYESRRHDPFIDLRFFRSIPFAAATVTAICAFSAWGAFLFMMSLYLQSERGYSAMHTGLIYAPDRHWRAGVLADLRPHGRSLRRPPVAAGGRGADHHRVGAADLPDRRPPRCGRCWSIFAVFGIGFSMVNAPITNAAVSGMPLDRAGAASAVTSTSRQIGVSIGVALCGSVAGSALSHSRGRLRRVGASAVVHVRRDSGSSSPRWASSRPPRVPSLGRATRAADRRHAAPKVGVHAG